MGTPKLLQVCYATSLLQRNLFNQHPKINNLGKPNKKWLDYIRLLMTELDNHKFLRLKQDLNRVPLKQRFKYRYNDLIGKDQETRLVNLSKEQITAIKKYYFQDNANINKKLNLNMEKWDYF